MRSSLVRIAGMAVAMLLAGFLPALAGPLQGHWSLVEERYGNGQANLVPRQSPVGLEFRREDGRLSGRLRVGEDQPHEYAWPAFITQDGASRPVEVHDVTVAPDEGTIRARYRVDPSDDPSLALEVTETYAVSPDGESLTGTVEVRFVRNGTEPRGSFVLHRRFERQP